MQEIIQAFNFPTILQFQAFDPKINALFFKKIINNNDIKDIKGAEILTQNPFWCNNQHKISNHATKHIDQNRKQ